MYLNKLTGIQTRVLQRLTVTLDVFKCYTFNIRYTTVNRLTVTLDVFK